MVSNLLLIIFIVVIIIIINENWKGLRSMVYLQHAVVGKLSVIINLLITSVSYTCADEIIIIYDIA